MVDHRYSSSYPSTNHSPSFSSALLDAIYRSIEAENTSSDNYYKDPINIRMKQINKHGGAVRKEEEDINRRAYMIDKWMEKKKKKTSIMDNNRDDEKLRKPFSDQKAIKPPSSECFFPRPKPVRTGCSRFEKAVKNRERRASFGDELGSDFTKQERGGGSPSTTNSSWALKIYGDLKKVKQPISPGGKLAVFLNSLFSNGGNTKQEKKTATAKIVSTSDDSPSNAKTTPCLSKTPPSCRKASNGGVNGGKRSVSFSSVSVIVEDDFDQKKAHNSNFNKASKDAIRSVIDLRKPITVREIEEKDRFFGRDSHEDDDGSASYSSSDLFELDNLSLNGLMEGSYRDELPVYETTNLQ